MEKIAIDWVARAKALFDAPKPQHFTDFSHCEECAEHDQVLLAADIDSIGLDELGNPGWDPLCFTSAEGKKYYLPALVRLCLATMESEFYLAQFLFHLEGSGATNEFHASCNESQCRFIADFIAYLMVNHSTEIEKNMCGDCAVQCHNIWDHQAIAV